MASLYRVQRGDTLGKIARKFYGAASRYPLIVAANAIANPDYLKVGQELLIPDLDVASRALNSVATPDLGPAVSRASSTALNHVRLAALHPNIAERGHAMLELCAQAGMAVLVTQGLRTWEEQDELYAQGRTKPPIGKKFIVTRARGGQSWHNFGLAFDIVVLDALGKANWDPQHPGWRRAALVGKSLGLDWGGDWVGFKDLPHFQYTGNLTLGDARSLHKQGLPAVWEQVA